jgi:hypothetical protein
MGRALSALRTAVAVLLVSFAGAYPATAAEEEAPARPLNQMRLTEAHIQNFISAQPELPDLAAKLEAADGAPSPELRADLDAMAKTHGFSSFAELDDVAANISLVMAGLDPDTGAFTEPLTVLKKELEDIQADGSIPEGEKKQLVSELNEAIASTPALQFSDNVPLVKAHREDIEKGLE